MKRIFHQFCTRSFFHDPSQTYNNEQQIWYEVKDVKSKKTFYFESVSQKTQWNRPEGVTIIPINQRGVAIILGNGVIEKNYLSSHSNMQYINQDEHTYDHIEYTQQKVFSDHETHSEVSTPTNESSPFQEQYVFLFVFSFPNV